MQNAYQRAVYRIFTPPIQWQIGYQSDALDRYLEMIGADTALFITAYNPGSVVLTDKENAARSAQLEQWIVANGHLVIKGQGEDPTGTWRPEASFLIPKLDLEEGKALGRRWGQNAIVFLKVGEAPRLEKCL